MIDLKEVCKNISVEMSGTDIATQEFINPVKIILLLNRVKVGEDLLFKNDDTLRVAMENMASTPRKQKEAHKFAEKIIRAIRTEQERGFCGLQKFLTQNITRLTNKRNKTESEELKNTVNSLLKTEEGKIRFLENCVNYSDAKISDNPPADGEETEFINFVRDLSRFGLDGEICDLAVALGQEYDFGDLSDVPDNLHPIFSALLEIRYKYREQQNSKPTASNN